MHELGAEVDGSRVEGVLRESGVPVEAEFGFAVGVEGFEVPRVAGFAVYEYQFAALRLGVDVARVVALRHGLKAVAEVHLLPVGVADAA